MAPSGYFIIALKKMTCNYWVLCIYLSLYFKSLEAVLFIVSLNDWPRDRGALEIFIRRVLGTALRNSLYKLNIGVLKMITKLRCPSLGRV